MGIPTRVLITLAIIVGVGLGTGCLVFGICASVLDDEKFAAFIAGGGALLTASIAAGIAHAAGGFRDWDDGGP